jgi:hypothetical protein
VPLLIVLGLVVPTDPVVPIGAALGAFPDVPTVGVDGVVDGAAPGTTGVDVPGDGVAAVIGADAPGAADAVVGVFGVVFNGVLDVVLDGVPAGAVADGTVGVDDPVVGALVAVLPVAGVLAAVLPVAGVPAAFADAMPLPTVGVVPPAGVPVTPATPGAFGSHGVSGVAR